MIVLGVILLIVGYLLGIQLLWVLGAILAVVGVAFAVVGGSGRMIGGRRYWY